MSVGLVEWKSYGRAMHRTVSHLVGDLQVSVSRDIFSWIPWFLHEEVFQLPA